MGNLARSQIFDLEAAMLQMPQVEMRLVEYFSSGVYARELHIPAGTVVTGAIHKYENLNILSKGEMTVPINGEMVRVLAPYTVVSPPGTKRAVFAHTDCVWTTILATQLTDSAAITEHFTCNSEALYLAHCDNLKLEGK